MVLNKSFSFFSFFFFFESYEKAFDKEKDDKKKLNT